MSVSVCAKPPNYGVCGRPLNPRPSAARRVKKTQRAPDLHDVEEHLLAQAVLLLEELVLGVGAGDVPANQLLARRRHLQQLRVLVLDGHVLGVAQQLPHDGPEVVRDPQSDQFLREEEPREPIRSDAVTFFFTQLCS